jgi:PAS domain S-box-containing protein
MGKPLRVLLVEDSEDDVLLTVRALKKGGYDPLHERVENAGAMRKALQEKTWDVILCDYQMPQFDGLAAISLLKKTGSDIPLIILSGAIGEETAVECMRLGAHDYIMKDKLARLVPAIERELREAESRSKRRQAEEALKESEERYRSFTDSTSDMVFLKDDEFKYIMVNHAYLEFYKCNEAEILGKTFLDFMPEKRVRDCHASDIQVRESNKLVVTIEHDEKRIVETRKYPVRLKEGKIGVGGIVRDITDRKRAEEALKESENKYRLIAENMTDVITIMDINLRFTFVSPSIMRLRGFTVEEVMDQSLEQIMTPESLQISAKVFEEEMQREASGTADPDRVRIIEVEEYRKDMTRVWVEVSLSYLRDADGRPIGILSLTRDITERKKAEKDLKETLESLRKALGTTTQVLVSAIEVRDPYTAGHQIRSTNLACAIATEMGLPQEKIEGIRMAGSIHDIGKLSIPAEILSKPTKLTGLEFSLIKEHSVKGYEMLKDVESPWPLAEIVYQHHERMDGSGYPRSLKGDAILMEARILAVADVVESMASHRPYRPALGINAALEEIEKNKGILYDNAVADACLRLFREKGFELDGI